MCGSTERVLWLPNTELTLGSGVCCIGPGFANKEIGKRQRGGEGESERDTEQESRETRGECVCVGERETEWGGEKEREKAGVEGE